MSGGIGQFVAGGRVPAVVALAVLAGCGGVPSGSPTAGGASGVTDTTAEQSPSPTVTASPTITTSPTTMTKHPGLDSVLYRLVRADNRTAFAAEHGIELTQEGATVLVELAPGRDLPDGYDVTVVASHEDLVRARVTVDGLVPLADHGNVSHIRRPPESNTDQ